MWTYQFASLQFALVISVDYRCASGHLIHERTLTLDYADNGTVSLDDVERRAGHDVALAYAEWRH